MTSHTCISYIMQIFSSFLWDITSQKIGAGLHTPLQNIFHSFLGKLGARTLKYKSQHQLLPFQPCWPPTWSLEMSKPFHGFGIKIPSWLIQWWPPPAAQYSILFTLSAFILDSPLSANTMDWQTCYKTQNLSKIKKEANMVWSYVQKWWWNWFLYTIYIIYSHNLILFELKIILEWINIKKKYV